MKPERAVKGAGATSASVGESSGATVSSNAQIGETGAESEKPEGKGGAKKERVEIDFSKVKIEPLFEEEVDFDTFSKSDFRVVKIKSCEEVKKSDKLLKFVLNDGSGEDRVILSGIKQYYDPSELV